jgi:hypothetical protein
MVFRRSILLRRIPLVSGLRSRTGYFGEVGCCVDEGEENNNRIIFDSGWICFITAKKIQLREMANTPVRQLHHLQLDNHSVIVLAQL